MTLSFRSPSRFDVWWVSEHMSPADRLECEAFGYTPIDALDIAVESSILCWTGVVNGMPQAIFGVTPVSLGTGWGRPWFLGTDRARQEKRAFLKTAPMFLNRISAIFPRLDNYVHRDNVATIGWLRKMGFVVDTKATVFGGEPMLHFYSKDF